ncbi:hypothetical protein PC123_g7892 [Phytophthora cactorum]|nr:hypothetical protein PC123_g7892 [Phytophthora cactorum]
MKGWIGRNPAKNVSELEEKVEASKGRIVSEDWKKAYRSIQKEEDKYLQALEDDEIECADIECYDNQIAGCRCWRLPILLLT